MSTKIGKAQRDPSDALRQLCDVAVDFERWWSEEETEDRLVDGVHSDLTHHRLLMEFFDFFAANHRSLNEQQLRSLGAWLNEAVAVDDDLCDAVATCFLQNCREQNLDRSLAPFLSAHTRAKPHA